jgi:hypothetical protein
VQVQFEWRSLPIWRRVLAVALGLAWAFLMFGLVLVLVDEAELRDTGHRATARVLEVRLRGRDPDYADVRFVTEDGREVTAEVEVTAMASFPDVGDEIDIVYDPDDPAEEVAVAEVHRVFYWLDVLLWVPLLGLSLGWIPLAIGGVKVSRRRRRAQDDG